MSTDIHLHLDENEPEQQRALSVLTAWQQQGYDAEQVITRALLVFAEGREQSTNMTLLLGNVREMLQQMREVLREVRALRLREAAAGGSTDEAASGKAVPSDAELIELSTAFVSALKKAARPGMKLDS